MGVTWGELEKMQLTWAEIDQLGLTWEQWHNITSAELLTIARSQLERFQENPKISQDQLQKIMPIIQGLVINVASNLTSDALKSVEWNNLLKQVVAFLSYILRQHN